MSEHGGPTRVRAMWLRGGTSKSGSFRNGQLPAGLKERDACLLRAYGSPGVRQIDGMPARRSWASAWMCTWRGGRAGSSFRFNERVIA
jgi:4-oxalomesaconate tautomerase